MKPFTYLAIDIGCILVPFLASFYPKAPFYKEWRAFIPANLLVATIFLIWDYFFTEMGIWGFNSDYLTGIYLANLPIEEVLFFICIPYACVFTYFALQYLLNSCQLKKVSNLLQRGLVFLGLIVGFTHLDQWYTATTFLGLAGFLGICIAMKKDMSWAIFSYLVILPFFFASNGILTGSFLESPIVWYNDFENLGIRMFTIPLEDTFYGLLMILMNVFFYEAFKRKNLI